MPVTLPHLRFITSPNQSSRRGARVNLVVLHDTEGSYDGAIAWFRSTASQVSAHIVLREDGLEATQMVPYAAKAWHCMAFNSESIGLEMAGIARRGFAASELRHAARIIAFLLHDNGLPPKLVKPVRVGSARGWTCHQLLGALGGGHSDPGFSRTKLLWFSWLVKREYKRGNFRKEWGV